VNIDPKTGEVIIDPTLNVGPTTSLTAFLASQAGKAVEKWVENAPYCSYRVIRQDGKQKFHFILQFKSEQLQSLSLSRTAHGEWTSWNAWSEQAAQDQKRAHDEWLKSSLGKPPYEYRWGSVESVNDSRSGSSSIIVSYASRSWKSWFR
jgi:hypothetical protein